MVDFVILSLVAPMGAFGGPAGHERRGSNTWPGRSAILGLIGAALGIRREERIRQEALNLWCTAVSVLTQGPVTRDFHSVQTVPVARIKRPRTRAVALEALNHSDNGLITKRDYRMDCAFGVALWGGEGASALISALEKPTFTPYLGRKSCPLSAPMSPRFEVAEGPLQALQRIKLPDFMALDPAMPLFVVSDESLGQRERVEAHWDNPTDRQKWHFSMRDVHIYQPQDEGAR